MTSPSDRRLANMLLVALAVLAATSTAHAADRPDDAFTRDFGVIVERNIFLRDRRPPPPPPPATTPTTPAAPAPVPPEKRYILVGVVFEDLAARAYFEQVGPGTLLKVAPGDAIANGHITEIQLNAVAYHDGKSAIWIDVGQDLTGAQITARPTPDSTSATTPTEGETAKPAADAATLSIEERMRQRRLQQLGQ